MAIGFVTIVLGVIVLLVFTLRSTVPARPFALYVADSPASSDDPIPIRALDPATLVDRPDQPPVVARSGTWALSIDGSTLLELHYGDPSMAANANPITIVARDGRTGAERLRFQPSADVVYPRLSQDGRRLLLQYRPTPGAMAAGTWQVFDTTTGQEEPAVHLPPDGAGYRTWLDSRATRLYVLASPGLAREAVGPAPATLLADDLTTGGEIGRIALPTVVEGSWPTDRTAAQETVRGYLLPGLAVAPDGEHVAIVHGDSDAITLVDARPMRVAREIRPAARASLIERLGLAPAVAEAKADEGTEKEAVFGPDGRHLFVFGTRSWIDANGQPVWRGLGISLIDLDRPKVVARALADESFFWVQPAPDGRSLYTFGPTGSGSFILRRLDATSLQPLAERRFAKFRSTALASLP